MISNTALGGQTVSSGLQKENVGTVSRANVLKEGKAGSCELLHEVKTVSRVEKTADDLSLCALYLT